MKAYWRKHTGTIRIIDGDKHIVIIMNGSHPPTIYNSVVKECDLIGPTYQEVPVTD